MVEGLLSSITPHLRVKHRQACLLSDFVRHRNCTVQPHVGRFFAPIPDDVVTLRETLYRGLRMLNAKGVGSRDLSLSVPFRTRFARSARTTKH